jgi:recombination protein RecT
MDDNKELLQKIQPRFTEIVDEKTFKIECSFAVQAFNKNDYLNKATPESKLQSVLNVAQTGLTLNPVRNHAYLIPRSMNGRIECNLMPSYRGLVHLIMRTGQVMKIDSQVVREGDEFDYELGLRPNITHKPSGSDSEITHVYAFAKLINGEVMVEVMTKEEIDRVRSNSDSYKSYVSKGFPSPWVQWESAMARKVVIKRLAKYLPEGKEWEQVSRAIEIDNQDYQAEFWQLSKIEGLLETSSFEHEDREFIEDLLPRMSYHEANEWIQRLKKNQISKVHEGMANQAEITEHIAKISKDV